MNSQIQKQEPDHGQALPTGTRIEEFIIERVLGSGGFGITYLATDTSLGRQVVIKENLPVQFCFRDTHSLTVAPRHTTGEDVANFQWSLENFSKEAAMLASLNHPGIVKVLRSFKAFATAYFVMPFVEGIPLDELMNERQRERKPFSEEELRGLLEYVLSALDHLHQRGIYHRDIKPANLLITNEGVPVLIDFGSARQRLSERSMTVVESAGYTPFEQLQSRGNVGPWSDLYALGATVVKVMTGEAPPKTNDRTMGDPWQPMSGRTEITEKFSERFLAGLDRALRLPVEERWQDASEWQNAMVYSSGPEADPASQTSHSPTPAARTVALRKAPAKKRKSFATGVVMGLIGMAGLVGVILETNQSKPTPAVVESPPPVLSPMADTGAALELEAKPLTTDSAPEFTPEITPSGVPLVTELPPELIEGMPKPMNVPNLLPAPIRASELLVPAGTLLLSRGKPVTSSDDAPIIGSLDLITDGEKDAGEGYFMEILDGLQWVQIDLEQSASISAVWLWHFHSQKRAYNDVIIQVSDDPDFRTGITTIYNNDYDDSARMGKGPDRPYVETRFGMIADGRGAKGRYVRLYSNGNTSNEMNHYIEVEVFGLPMSEKIKMGDFEKGLHESWPSIVHRIQEERDLRMIRQNGSIAELFDLRGHVFVINVISVKHPESSARSLAVMKRLAAKYAATGEFNLVSLMVDPVPTGEIIATLTKTAETHGMKLQKWWVGGCELGPLHAFIRNELKAAVPPREEDGKWIFDSAVVLIDKNGNLRRAVVPQKRGGPPYVATFDFDQAAKWDAEGLKTGTDLSNEEQLETLLGQAIDTLLTEPFNP